MKASKLAATFCSVVALLGLSIGAQAQTTLKLGHVLSKDSHYAAGATAFADEVAKRTNGRVKIQQFPSGSLGGEREMVESVQLGTLDFVITSTGPVGNFVPETLIMDLPFLFRDYDHARKVLDGQIGQELLAKFPAKGLVALAWGENGFRHLTNSKRPVNAPDDMKGLKIRTMENPIHMIAFKTLGAQPTPMAFPELFGALQQGTVDGQENPIPVIVSSKFSQVQKHLSLTGHLYSPALIITSPVILDKLSAADKKAVQEAAVIGAQAMRKRVNEIETKGMDELKTQGVAIVNGVDKSAFQKALGVAYTDYARRFGVDAIERIRSVK
ncbi:MAG: TRAP transporter substrate-binding protein [Noviherbaspirillum sp.]